MSEPNDKLLDEYLRRESAVSQRYRELDANEVPPELDAAVLAQARAAVGERTKRKPGWVRWGAPLALAASAVMAVAIVLEVGVREEVRMPAPQLERAPSAEPAQATRAEKALAYEDAQAEVAAAAEQERRAEDAALADRATRAESLARAETPQKEDADVRRAAKTVQPPAEAYARRRDASQPVAPAAAPPPAAAIGERAVLSAAPAAADQQAPRLAPAEWLERIRTLRREGKALEADQQWREFREAYPDFEVSETDAARPQR